jgi:hypothetical protein
MRCSQLWEEGRRVVAVAGPFALALHSGEGKGPASAGYASE